MSRKGSIINSSSIAAAIFLFYVAICEAELTEPRTQRDRDESEVESSINSGIRTLEYIRRQIIDSRKGRDENRAYSSVEEPQTSGYSRYSGAAAKEEDSLTVKSTESRHPRRQVDSAMYEALSKIANIQIADSNMDHSSGSGSSADGSIGRRVSQSTFHDSIDEKMNKQLHKNVGITRTLKNEGSNPKTSIVTSNKPSFTLRKFHCRPIRDIYIPKVDKRMPAYLCTFGKRAFVISSERFIQDRRDHFEVSVDENTFRRLNPMNSGTATLTSGVSVLPATLVLKQGENGYTVRGLNKVQGNSTP